MGGQTITFASASCSSSCVRLLNKDIPAARWIGGSVGIDGNHFDFLALPE